MHTDDDAEIPLMRPEEVAWERVSWVQVKRYNVGRRMELGSTGPVRSLPLLGTVRSFAVEVVHADDTWDRTHWLDSPVDAHRAADEMAEARGLTVRVVP